MRLCDCDLIGHAVKVIAVPDSMKANENYLVGQVGTVRAFMMDKVANLWFTVQLENGTLWKLYSGNLQVLEEATEDDIVEEEVDEELTSQFSAFVSEYLTK